MALFGETPAPLSRLEELKRVLQRDPTSRQFLALAEEYRRQGKMRDAIISLERGLSIHTSSVAAHVALGKAYQHLERWEDAIRSYQNALRYDRENLPAIRQLAEVYLARGDKLEALKKLKLYRGLKPGDREVQESITRLEAELEAPPPSRFPSGIRPLADATAHGTTPPRALPLREVAPLESAPPFDLPTEPAWAPQDWERRTEPVPAAPPESPPAETAAAPAPPSWGASEEVFPAGRAPAGREPEVPEAPRVHEISEVPEALEVPTRVPSAEGEAFLETEISPEAEETRPAWPAAPPAPETAPEPAPVEASAQEAAPLPPLAFESGVRPGLTTRERYERPQPIEMTAEETATVSATPPFPESLGAEVEPSPSAPAAPEEATEVAPSEATAPEAEMDRSESPTGPLVTETLAELYRSQGYLVEAREVYLALAASATDPEASRTYARRAEALRVSRQNAAIRKRLEGLLTPFPPPAPVATEDLSALLRSLVAEVPGLRAAVLTDREGLPVVTEGLRESGEALDVLVAELTSFVKQVGRSGAEIGSGPLRSLAVVGEKGAAILANVTSDYALVLEAEPEAALGEVRWVAARAAERLRPAVG